MVGYKRVLWLFICLTVIVAACSWLVQPPSSLDAKSFHFTFMFDLIFAMLSFAAGVLFLVGLKGFTANLRTAYRLIATGILIWGLAQLQIPTLLLLNNYNNSWNTNGITNVPYFISGALMLYGCKRLAVLLNIKPRFLHYENLLLITSILCCASAFLFYVAPPKEASAFSLVLTTVDIAQMLLAFLALLAIKRVSGRAFINALAWFVVAMGALVIATCQIVVLYFVGFTDNPYVTSGTMSFVFLIAVGIMVKAALAFNKIRTY